MSSAVYDSRAQIDLSPSRLLAGGTERLEVWGRPTADDTAHTVEFDGRGDALILPDVRLGGRGWPFRVRVSLCPDAGGSTEQRFLHIQDAESDDRFLMELRLDGEAWYADTYFMCEGREALLVDPAQRVPVGIWSSYEVTYDGEALRHCVSGGHAMEAEFRGGRLPGRTRISVGIRANGVSPYRGSLGTVVLSLE